jgi:hypothetical protein
MAAKHLHDGYEQDGDQPGDNRMRRLPSLSTYGSRVPSFFLLPSWLSLLLPLCFR